MIWKIGMPNLGHTMDQGSVTKWLKREGDPVAKGEPLVVVETDKASYEVESLAEGVLLKILAPEGSVVPIGGTIGVIGSSGDVLSHDIGSAKIELRQEPAPDISSAKAQSQLLREKTRLQVSPIARSLAEQLKVDLKTVTGTGRGGLITKEDVLRAMKRENASMPGEWQGIRRVPLSPMRKTIAARVLSSWQHAPMVTLVRSVDVTATLEYRAQDGNRVSINDLVLRATAKALRQHPRLNAWFIDGEVREVEDVNLGVVIAVEDGLLVPVIRAAQAKTVYEISREVVDLAEKAKAGALGALDVADGTFTVSNLGAWGIEWFTPILNPPQVAILGVGAGARLPQEAPTGVTFISALKLCLVFDHRVVDGAGAAGLLQTLSAILSDPGQVFAAAP